jgi:serine/threonine protein kinase
MLAKPNDTGSLKIVDFGLSARYSRGGALTLTEKCGTTIYTAPEVFANYEYSKALRIVNMSSMWTYGVWVSSCTLY